MYAWGSLRVASCYGECSTFHDLPQFLVSSTQQCTAPQCNYRDDKARATGRNEEKEAGGHPESSYRSARAQNRSVKEP